MNKGRLVDESIVKVSETIGRTTFRTLSIKNDNQIVFAYKIVLLRWQITRPEEYVKSPKRTILIQLPIPPFHILAALFRVHSQPTQTNDCVTTSSHYIFIKISYILYQYTVCINIFRCEEERRRRKILFAFACMKIVIKKNPLIQHKLIPSSRSVVVVVLFVVVCVCRCVGGIIHNSHILRTK